MENKFLIYKNLEDKMVKFRDLRSIRVKDNNEPMVPIIESEFLKSFQMDKRMEKYTGSTVYVRKGVEAKLVEASLLLQKILPNKKLQVVYGYRALEIQTNLFEEFRKELDKGQSREELFDEIHRYIAVPEVSGHPTGGAVDIQIIDENDNPLNFGTKIWEFEKDSYTFSPFVNKDAKKNRKILGELMVNVGFAPFDGEWWHYSYGDREWAFYYEKKSAIYSQISFQI